MEKAITNLRRAKLLTPIGIDRIPTAKLAKMIRPTGYFRQKAKKLKAFVAFLRKDFAGSVQRFCETPTEPLRGMLLDVYGIGPETADSILLYAAKKPSFVIDAYTRRVLTRHGNVGESAKYEEMRELFEKNLPRDAQLYNEYHALLVQVGKNWCRPREARCNECPLGSFLPQGQPLLAIITSGAARS